jgi:glutathione synthase/RimK-type ligase-like ATP-grasp enzyme
MKSVFVGVPGRRRATLWQEALRSRGWSRAEEIAYVDLLSGAVDLSERLDADAVLRLESPDDDLETNAQILGIGASLLESHGGRTISDSEARSAIADRGRIVHPQQWYLGFQSLMSVMATALNRAMHGSTEARTVRTMNDPAAAAILYDKVQSQSILSGLDVPIPPGLKIVEDYDDVRAFAREAPGGRVMVKLRHGSAAAGAIAIEAVGPRIRALTTAELVETDESPKIYLTRRIRTLHGEAEIAKVVDAIGPWGLFAEAWLPKDRWRDGRRYDLRVLTIGGEPHHAVARISRSPFTNLNLLNERADASPLREREWWSKVVDVCRRTAQAFDQSLYLGIDVLVTPHGRDVYVLEANAFGDLIPGILHRGLSTYEAEIAALEADGW